MEYPELSKLYHRDTSPERESHAKNALRKRLESDATYRTGYQTPSGELFVHMTREVVLLIDKILRVERKVSSESRKLPRIPQHAILRGMALDEVVSSNEIEGVHSTRRQIEDALRSADDGKPDRHRFKEMALLYLDILDDKAVPPESPKDIRNVYDKIMAGELTPRNKPDGKLFRAGGVSVNSGTRTIHNGIEPESKITEAMQAMLEIAQTDAAPSLVSAMVAHFLFEYAHPFYDGNGRTGRYLLAVYLSEPLSPMTTLSLSRVIAEHKEVYYRAFDSAEDPLNHGELTHFVYSMLELVNNAQQDILERLSTSQEVFEGLEDTIKSVIDEQKLDDKDAEITFMLMQYAAFGLFGDTPLRDLTDPLQASTQTVRRHLAALEARGIVVRKRKRSPITFALTDAFRQRYGIPPAEQ